MSTNVQVFIAEMLGTFFFLSVILATGEVIPIAIALAAAIFLTAKISGGHLNPAVSLMFNIKGDIDTTGLANRVVAQLLGGILAYYFWKFNQSKNKK
jgi:glycerol uptake facilitator-like aquaporin